VVDVLFPPAHRMGDVGAALMRSGTTGGAALGDSALLLSVLWLVSWGLLAFIAGLLLLRHRPLAA